jgi:hypothetical protein
MMKKITFIILTLMFAIPLNAQFDKHEISASYGMVTANQIADIFEDLLVSIFTLGHFEKSDYSYTGAIFLTYKNGVSNRWNLGFTAGIDKVQANLMWDDELQGYFKENHTTIAAETDFRWVKRPFFELYSGLGLGYTFTTNYADLLNGGSERVSSGNVAVQINPLGIRLGKKIGFYTEFGFGYKGILNFGASVKF